MTTEIYRPWRRAQGFNGNNRIPLALRVYADHARPFLVEKFDETTVRAMETIRDFKLAFEALEEVYDRWGLWWYYCMGEAIQEMSYHLDKIHYKEKWNRRRVLSSYMKTCLARHQVTLMKRFTRDTKLVYGYVFRPAKISREWLPQDGGDYTRCLCREEDIQFDRTLQANWNDEEGRGWAHAEYFTQNYTDWEEGWYHHEFGLHDKPTRIGICPRCLGTGPLGMKCIACESCPNCFWGRRGEWDQEAQWKYICEAHQDTAYGNANNPRRREDNRYLMLCTSYGGHVHRQIINPDKWRTTFQAQITSADIPGWRTDPEYWIDLMGGYLIERIDNFDVSECVYFARLQVSVSSRMDPVSQRMLDILEGRGTETEEGPARWIEQGFR